MNVNIEYFKKEGLDKLIEGKLINGEASGQIAPDINDLVRIHKLIRKRKPFTVLEFGLGFSTIIIADAILKNKTEWEKLEQTVAIRNSKIFKLFSVDASKDWIKLTESKIPEEFKNIVEISHSEVEIGNYNGQLCHFYKNIPDVVADFIYLDGPSPKDVQGRYRGLSFSCDERTVMSGDLLLMESTFLPGTFIIVDGRTNNVRFLKNNFKREYKFIWDKEGDISTFELTEERLGKYNLLGSDLY